MSNVRTLITAAFTAVTSIIYIVGDLADVCRNETLILKEESNIEFRKRRAKLKNLSKDLKDPEESEKDSDSSDDHKE